jgi:ABC-2 type transport system ATP-binding protein
MASAPEPPVEARDLSRVHPNGLGVRGVDLAVHRGQVLGLLGPNGSGKTTLLRVLATANAPTGGTVTWFGSFDRRDPAVRRRMGVMLDNAVHFGALSARQNAAFFAALYGCRGPKARSRLEELFEWAGLAGVADLPVREYSLGMQRRLSLVETFAHSPELLILDEPSLALDYKGEVDLESRLREAAAAGAAIVVATNDPRLCRVCDGRLTLDRGRPSAAAWAA